MRRRSFSRRRGRSSFRRRRSAVRRIGYRM